MPHMRPKTIQRRGVEVDAMASVVPSGELLRLTLMPRMRRARTMTQVKSAVVRDISQSHRTAYCMAAGCRAQVHADQTAVLRLKQRMAISHTARAVAAERTQLMARSTHAEAGV